MNTLAYKDPQNRIGRHLSRAKGLLLLLTVIVSVYPVDAQNKTVGRYRDIPISASPFLPDLTPGYVLIQGDIQIPLEQYKAMFDRGIQLMATYGPAILWPDNAVPYDFVTSGGGTVSAANQSDAIHAMDSIALRAGITFRPATSSDANRIRFQSSTANNSTVGMQGGTQIINIYNWEINIIICHEIYHSLGFQHEQSRSDRDTYVTINNANVCGTASTGPCAPDICCMCKDLAGNCKSCIANFDTVSASMTYGRYDFDSFMHYDPTSFSCNGSATISVNPPYTASIGQRDHFSYFDAITCRALYPFPNDRWLDPNSIGDTPGTFREPFNNTTLAGAISQVPSGGTLLIKFNTTISAVGTYNTPVTIMAPNGATLSK